MSNKKEIVPHEKGPGKESVEKERRIIRTVLEGGDDVELPWVQPSKKETGQA